MRTQHAHHFNWCLCGCVLPLLGPLSVQLNCCTGLAPGYHLMICRLSWCLFVLQLIERNAPGYAIGGLAGGETKDMFWKVVAQCAAGLPPGKPRYVMGIGYPLDVVVCSALGADMYDSVYPTRTARFGVALVDAGGWGDALPAHAGQSVTAKQQVAAAPMFVTMSHSPACPCACTYARGSEPWQCHGLYLAAHMPDSLRMHSSCHWHYLCRGDEAQKCKVCQGHEAP